MSQLLKNCRSSDHILNHFYGEQEFFNFEIFSICFISLYEFLMKSYIANNNNLQRGYECFFMRDLDEDFLINLKDGISTILLKYKDPKN